MEKKLKKLFDYQRFEKNERLEKIINETENQYGEELTDYDLSLVDAAGEINPCKVEADSGFNAAGIGGGTQIGGLTGECKSNVSGFNIGGLAGDYTGIGGLSGIISNYPEKKDSE